MKLDPQLRTLKAIKPHKYGTRHLTAGEEYEAPPKYAVALVAARKAQFADKKPTVMPTPQVEPAPAPDTPSIDSLRLEATQLGINVDGRWGVARLRSEIAEAKSR